MGIPPESVAETQPSGSNNTRTQPLDLRSSTSAMKCVWLLTILCTCLTVDALNPYIGLLGRNIGSSSSVSRPWDSSSSNRHTPEFDLPWMREPVQEDANGRIPCVGLCYTLKLLKMAEENKQKRYDGYLYDFYRK